MLACSCEWDGDSWYYTTNNRLTPFPVGRRKRCCSCKRLINICEDCIVLWRLRDALTDVERKIVGDEVPLSNWYLCEDCSEIYLNLDSLGYCYYAGDNLRENLEDYWNITGFDPNNYRRR